MTSTTPTNDLSTLQQWIGRTVSRTETISLASCQRLHDTLDLDGELQPGDTLPALWHFIHHLDSVPFGRLGRDGHPERGGFLPPVALPRRMWAGGRFSFDGDIAIGDTVTKTSTIDTVAMKDGRSGQLCFVTVSHELSVEGEVRITEEQDLVYRQDPAPDAPRPQPKSTPGDSDWHTTITPSEVQLFRYSALTFNAHRIHYDRNYAREVEGYEDLVVHGPLTATLLAGLAAENIGPLASFSFRGVAPLFDSTSFTIAGKASDAAPTEAELWAATPDGNLAMTAEATARP